MLVYSYFYSKMEGHPFAAILVINSVPKTLRSRQQAVLDCATLQKHAAVTRNILEQQSNISLMTSST